GPDFLLRLRASPADIRAAVAQEKIDRRSDQRDDGGKTPFEPHDHDERSGKDEGFSDSAAQNFAYELRQRARVVEHPRHQFADLEPPHRRKLDVQEAALGAIAKGLHEML